MDDFVVLSGSCPQCCTLVARYEATLRQMGVRLIALPGYPWSDALNDLLSALHVSAVPFLSYKGLTAVGADVMAWAELMKNQQTKDSDSDHEITQGCIKQQTDIASLRTKLADVQLRDTIQSQGIMT